MSWLLPILSEYAGQLILVAMALAALFGYGSHKKAEGRHEMELKVMAEERAVEDRARAGADGVDTDPDFAARVRKRTRRYDGIVPGAGDADLE